MKIGFISHWFDPEGGAAAGPGTIARALAERGHELHVVTGYPIYPQGHVFPDYKIRPYSKERLDNLTVHRFPIYPSHSSSARQRFMNYASFAVTGALGATAILPRLDCAFVYSTPATAALPALTLKALRGLPYVVQIQDLWPQTITASGMLSDKTAAIANAVLQPFCDLVYRGADRVCVTSPGMSPLIESRGIAPKKIVFTPNWADEASFQPTVRDHSLAQELGIQAKTTIMYAGNFGRMQNLEIILSAAAMLRHDTGVQFVLVGAGVMETELKAEVARLGLKNVLFVPPQPFSRMSNILALGDAQLVTLKDEPLFQTTLPSKLQANLAAGRPIIGVVAGDAAHVIRRSGAGLVAEPGDAASLASAVRTFTGMSNEEHFTMQARARQYYLQNFSKSIVAEQIETTLVSAQRSQRQLP